VGDQKRFPAYWQMMAATQNAEKAAGRISPPGSRIPRYAGSNTYAITPPAGVCVKVSPTIFR